MHALARLSCSLRSIVYLQAFKFSWRYSALLKDLFQIGLDLTLSGAKSFEGVVLKCSVWSLVVGVGLWGCFSNLNSVDFLEIVE